VAEYMFSTEIASPGVPCAAVMSARCVASEMPSLKVTMYETGGPDGAVVVVAAVVVAAGPHVVVAEVVVSAVV
jgi:hypothetical protein